jgi:Mrp family chromosome partitioning ATPase
LAGLVIVTSPQELVNMVVAKAINMAHQMEIPILGLVENMSYLECPQCGERIQVFGPSRTRAAAAGAGLRFLGALPLDKKLASLADEGRIEDYEQTTLQSLAEVIDG